MKKRDLVELWCIRNRDIFVADLDAPELIKEPKHVFPILFSLLSSVMLGLEHTYQQLLENNNVSWQRKHHYNHQPIIRSAFEAAG